jgi:hypothetical protein
LNVGVVSEPLCDFLLGHIAETAGEIGGVFLLGEAVVAD